MQEENNKNQISSEQKNSVTTRVGKIDKVDPIKDFHQATGNKWIAVFQKFNPLGAIADAYAQTLAYKIETKRLEVEQNRINKQAEITHNVLDKTFKLKMEELEQRKLALIGFYETVNRELERLHIERKKVEEMANNALDYVAKSNNMEEKILFKEILVELIHQLPNFGEQANVSLKTLVQTLPQVPPSALIDISN